MADGDARSADGQLIWPAPGSSATQDGDAPAEPGDDAPTPDLGSLYPWPEAGDWLRGCMVLTLDGAITGPDGVSKSISAPADQRILSEVRRRADAIVVGAATIRAERYRPMRDRPDAVGQRLAAGQRSAPVLTIVSRSLALDWDDPMFTDSSQRPIVVTVADSDAAARAAARRTCEVIVAGEQDLDPRALVAQLAERGLHRLTCEGGAQLLAALADADLVDELDLSIAPILAGSAGVRPLLADPDDQPADGRGGSVLRGMRLAHVLQDDGYLFTRYLRRRS